MVHPINHKKSQKDYRYTSLISKTYTNALVQCILPVTMYGAETKVLLKQNLDKLIINPTGTERKITTNIPKRYKTNNCIRERTRLKWN